MKTKTCAFWALGVASAFLSSAVWASQQIDWSMVPGSHGRNDVSLDFINPPNPFNEILSNNFTSWEPEQHGINQAQTSTGRAQRRALIASNTQAPSTEVISYNQSITTTQSAPSSEGLYSEDNSSQTRSQNSAQERPSPRQNQSQNQNQNQTSNQTGSIQKDAQARLAPHALIMESSLNSAMDQVKGIRSELDVAKRAPRTEQRSTVAYQTFIRQIHNDLNVVQAHEKQLLSDARKYPEIAKSAELRDVPMAIHDLRGAVASLESKANQTRYWMNEKQAQSDLDRIEKRLSTALDKVKNFSSGKLNTSVG